VKKFAEQRALQNFRRVKKPYFIECFAIRAN
jgi:hypothetical protein